MFLYFQHVATERLIRFKSPDTEYVDPIRIPIANFLSKISLNLYDKFIIVCLNAKKGLNRINNSHSPHIPNRKIFELPTDYTAYIEKYLSYLTKIEERVFLITVHLFA